MRITTTALAASLTFLAGLGAQTTTATVQIGGPNTNGLQGANDPPTLQPDGAATATLRYTYDAGTGRLLLDVENTTAPSATEYSPVITRVYLNIPDGAVTGLSLVGQSSAAANQPQFALSGPTTRVGSFGNFDYVLEANVTRGIANPNATRFSVGTGNLVMGIARFELQASGPNISTVSAMAFARSLSSGATYTIAACKFQSGGTSGNASGFIGTSKDCIPGLWYTGTPCIGQTITFVMSNRLGCHNCLTAALNQDPIVINGIPLPASPPYFVLYSQDAAASISNYNLPIPNNPLLVGQLVTFLNLSFDLNGPAGVAYLSGSVSFTICP